MQPTAYLSGTVRSPEVRLYFDPAATHLVHGTLLIDWVKLAPSRHFDGQRRCWVITAFGVDKNPDAMLRKAGFALDLVNGPPGQPLDPSLDGVLSLCDLMAPLVRASAIKPSMALCRPRFVGWHGARDLLGRGSVWDKANGRFEVPLTNVLLHGQPRPGLEVEPATVAAAQALLRAEESFGHARFSDAAISADLSTAAASSGLDLTGADQAAIDRLVEVTGDIPGWFGMSPYPYQRLGAMAISAGRSLLCDPTGLGKTLQVIGAFALRDVQRGVIVVPPVVVTNWAREIERCGLAAVPPKPPTKAELKRRERAAKKAATAAAKQAARDGASPLAAARAAAQDTANDERATAATTTVATPSSTLPGPAGSPLAPPSNSAASLGTGASSVPDDGAINLTETAPQRTLVVFRAGRKEPDLPETGIVVVPDSLLSARPALAEKIARWDPDGYAYDEAHRARTWLGKRSTVARDLVARMRPGTLTIAATATPLFSNPAELAPLLAISGHLDRVFGGYEAFMARYTKKDFFNKDVPRLEALPELRAILTEKVWVRRVKEEVLRDLPPKTRRGLILDVDLAGFRAAHDEVVAKICSWIDSFCTAEGRYPEDEEAQAWGKTQIGLISPLRKAAGVAKVPAALDRIAEWISQEASINIDGTVTCERPLIVWAHHQEVIQALRAAAPAHLKDHHLPLVKVIDGSTSSVERGRIVDEFQAGRIPVLVASITAAGVGITLTKSSDLWFLESDWSVPHQSQAEDRAWRIGQENHVSVTTLLAEGTLDGRIQDILVRKADLISKVLGEGSDAEMDLVEGDLDVAAAPAEIIASLVEVAVARHAQTRAKQAA